MSKKIKLSISLLVSNSIDTIEKCMKSLQPILENVPSELIIIDTGGTDGSIEVAREYATKVVPFTWCNDFAKARNAGLFEAQGEWFMYLDDDEWFEDVEPIISFFNTDDHLNYNSASYGIRNYANKQGTRWEDVSTHRMVKREKKTQFASPIHETLVPIKGPVKCLDCFVHHYGYAYANKEEARKHSQRNIPLIKEVLEKNPDEYRLILQLIKEYGVIGEYEMVANLSWNAIKRIQKNKDYTPANIRVLGWILCNIVKTNIIHDEYEQALVNVDKFINFHWINEITKNNLFFWAINVYYDLKNYESCLNHIPQYEKTYEILMQDDSYRRSQVVLEQESIVTESTLSNIYTIGICSACAIENRTQADSYFDKMLNLESYVKTREELRTIFKYLLEEKDENRRNIIISHLLKNNETFDNVSKIIDSDVLEDDMKKQICIMISEMESNDVKILPYHIYANHIKGNREDVKKALQFYLHHQENVFEIMYPLLMLIKDYDVDIIKEIERKDVKTWIVQQNDFVQKASEKKIETWIDILEKSSQRGFNTNMLYMRAMERRMRFKNIAKLGYGELLSILEKYTNTVKDIYCNVYREEIFDNQYSVFLPKNYRFTQKVKDIFQNGISKSEEAKVLKEAAEIYPEMSDFCKYYVIKIQEFEKEKKGEREEFLKLGNMIKDKIRMFIYRGEYEVARQTLNQLKMILPNDPELLELEIRIQD